MPYYGTTPTIQSHAENPSHLALIPTDYSSDYAHQTLYRLDALSDFIQTKIQHPYKEDGQVLNPEQQLNLRHFAQKIDEISAKFIVKVANHYKTAQLTPKVAPDPFAGMNTEDRTVKVSKAERPQSHHKTGASSVIKLILITIVICVIGYYFGL